MSSSITWGGGSVAELWSQILPVWDESLRVVKQGSGNYIIGNFCWCVINAVGGQGTYESHPYVTINGLKAAWSFLQGAQIYEYRNINCYPLKKDDEVTIWGTPYTKITLLPCQYIVDELESSPMIASNELGGQSPLEKLLIKDYYPLTEEQIKEAEEEAKKYQEQIQNDITY